MVRAWVAEVISAARDLRVSEENWFSMEVHLQHWEYEIPGDMLMRYGSPHFSEYEAGGALAAGLISNANMHEHHVVRIDERQVLCANEAFPEAAVADPIADLRVWDEWVSGHRVFPYPGRFSRLGLTRQEGKISSPSSVGIVGEILAGVFAQTYIAPQVLVRCIRRWPDFIFYTGGDIYAFVESKAFTGATSGGTLSERVPDGLLKEMMYDAVHQFNADPHLEIWGAFTGIVNVEPDLVATLTMVRLGPPPEKRAANPRVTLPEPVVRGVAERSVAQAAANVSPEELRFLGMRGERGAPLVFEGAGRRISRTELEKELIQAAAAAAESVLSSAAASDAARGSRVAIEEEINRLIRKYKPSAAVTGRRFFEIKERAVQSVLQSVRPAAVEWIFMADLSPGDVHRAEAAWKKGWQNAPLPIAEVEGCPVWRAGGAAYCLGPESLGGKPVRLG